MQTLLREILKDLINVFIYDVHGLEDSLFIIIKVSVLSVGIEESGCNIDCQRAVSCHLPLHHV